MAKSDNSVQSDQLPTSGANLVSLEGKTFVSWKVQRETRRFVFGSSGVEKLPPHKFFGGRSPKADQQINVAPAALDDLDLIKISRIGLANRNAQLLAERLELTAKETAQLLTLSPRTYHRKSPDEILNPVASERLLLLTKVADQGVAVFDDPGKFNRWLRRPLRILGDNAPLDILDTGQGIKLVETILGRMEHGVYS